jgi:Flp pilus assembly protein TadG
VLVSLILVPLFVGLIQLGLTLYVRNTVNACAHAAARYGANENLVAEGEQGGVDVAADAATTRAVTCIAQSLPVSYTPEVSAYRCERTIQTPCCPPDAIGCEPANDSDAIPVVEVKVRLRVPLFVVFDVTDVDLHVRADALQEQPP